MKAHEKAIKDNYIAPARAAAGHEMALGAVGQMMALEPCPQYRRKVLSGILSDKAEERKAKQKDVV